MSTSGNSEALSPQKGASQVSKIEEAKGLLKKIDDTFIGDQKYFDRLDTLLSEVDKQNTQDKEKLLSLLGDALREDSKFSWADRRDIQKLKDKWLASYEDAGVKKEDGKERLSAIVVPKIQEEKKKASIKTASFTHREKAGKDIDLNNEAINDKDPKKALQARLAFLSDMDGMSGVENNNKLFGRGNQKYIIGEKQLYNVLSHTITNQEQLDQLLLRSNITGNWTPEGMTVMREDFRDKIIARASVVASMARIVLGDQNAGAGLVSVIEGEEQRFINTLIRDTEQLKKIKTEIESNSPLGTQIVSTILSVGLGFLLKGFHFSLEHRDLDTGHPLAVILGDSMNFTAKLRVLEGVIQGNLNDRETQIIKDTLAFSNKLTGTVNAKKILVIPADMELSADEKELVKFYNDNAILLPEGSDVILIDELSRRHMLGLAKNEAGWSGKGVEAGYNLLSVKAYIGLTAQHIGSRVQVVGNNGAVAAELRSNRKKTDLKELGITTEETADKKIKYILPTMDTIPAELTELGAKIEDGKVVLISDTPLDFHRDTIYHTNGDTETRITINKKEQPVITTLPLTPVAPQKGVSKNAQKAREKLNTFKTLGGSIYVMSRDKKHYPKFDILLQEIGDKKYDDAYKNLRSQAQYGSKTAKNILSFIKEDQSNRDEVLRAVNTYTYGGMSKNKGEINKKGYAAERKKTIAAENRLSSGNGAAEAFFASKETHTSQHINTFFPGQAMSVSVFATPKGGTHRIDKYDGSIQVGGRPYIDGENGATMSDAQKNHILEDHKSAVEKNRAELNTYLKDVVKTKIQVTHEEYILMLKTGKLPDTLTKERITLKKKPQFFEARAMINGNVCVNRVDGLTFPTIEAPKVPPQVVIVPVIDESLGAPVGREIATTTEAGVGVGFKKGGEEVSPESGSGPGQGGGAGANPVGSPVGPLGEQ